MRISELKPSSWALRDGCVAPWHWSWRCGAWCVRGLGCHWPCCCGCACGGWGGNGWGHVAVCCGNGGSRTGSLRAPDWLRSVALPGCRCLRNADFSQNLPTQHGQGAFCKSLLELGNNETSPSILNLESVFCRLPTAWRRRRTGLASACRHGLARGSNMAHYAARRAQSLCDCQLRFSGKGFSPLLHAHYGLDVAKCSPLSLTWDESSAVR